MKWLTKLLEILVKFLEDKFPPPLPLPKPEPEPVESPKVPDFPEDEIDPRLVSWDEPRSPLSFMQTAKIIHATISPNGMAANYSGTDGWPARNDGGRDRGKPSIGNWWLIAKVDGKWHGATVEWLGPGKRLVTDKHWDGMDAIHGALTNWRYKPGEEVGIMLSGVCRAAPYTVAERTQIKKVICP